MKKKKLVSTSFITNNHIRVFKPGVGDAIYGFIYQPNDGFFVTSLEDAYSDEVIDNQLPIQDKNYKSDVFKIYNNKSNVGYAFGSKTILPENTHYEFFYSYNEVVIDSEKAKPVTVFYIIKTINHHGTILDSQKSISEAKALAKHYNLPVVDITGIQKMFSDREITSDGVKL